MLILPIKKKWFDMILSGEKREEYRELKPYYQKRFVHLWHGSLIGFDAKRKVMFRNGYSKQSPSFIATVTLDIGTGKTEWGAEEGKSYYILKICDIEPQAERYGFCVYHGIDCDYAGQCIKCPHNTEEDTEWFKQNEEQAESEE